MENLTTSWNKSNDTIVCYGPILKTKKGLWEGEKPLDYSITLCVFQITIIVAVTRLFAFILKPLHQPRVNAEILGGVFLGRSVLGRSQKFASTIFPDRSILVLDTMSNVGLLYFLFLIGVEMDLMVITRAGKKAISIAVAGMILPFLVGAAYALLTHHPIHETSQGPFIIFIGVSLSVTAFPVLARILAELKLINTDLGKIAMSSAIANDICAWILFALAIAMSENGKYTLSSVLVVISSVAFICFCLLVIRPVICWALQQTPEGEPFSEFYVCLILTGVMFAGFITDAIGTHSVFGAFIFGLAIPNGPLGVTLIEKIEDFVSGLLVPLFFAITGLRTDLTTIKGVFIWIVIMLLTLLSCAGKVVGTLLMSIAHKMSVREGITLGLLMNAKGLIEMIVLNVGKEKKVIDVESFSAMVISTLIVTGIITPIVQAVYRPTMRSVTFKHRSIERSKPDAELQILVCIHSPRIVPTIINLLEATNPTKTSPICVYILHLVELTGRASAMLIVHNTQKSGQSAISRTQAQSDHIMNAFENYEQQAGYVTVRPLTTISPYSTMHEDICTVAEDKHVNLIIIPFHKQQTVDGGMEEINPSFRLVNQNVLAKATCSVGILVDRGLNGSTMLAASQVSLHIAVLFFGGPDDIEALSYAWRMATHPRISLTVIRFVPSDELAGAAVQRTPDLNEYRVLRVDTDSERNGDIDEEFINGFRSKTASDDSIVYTEIEVNNGEDTVAAIRAMDDKHDLFMVGRGQGTVSPLTAGMTDWSECPELGVIGDLLASADFASTVSVLVIKQYVGIEAVGD